MNQSNELISVDSWLPIPNHNIHRLVRTLFDWKKKKKKQIVLTHRCTFVLRKKHTCDLLVWVYQKLVVLLGSV